MIFDPDTDSTVAATMSSIGRAARDLMGCMGTPTDPNSYRDADQALGYLKALVPVDHPARPALLAAEDKLLSYRTLGNVPHDAYEDLMVLAGQVMTEVAAKPIEAYTIGDHADLVEKIPVDDWLETGFGVRLVGGTDGYDRGRHIDAVHPGHRSPTLVIDDEGMPIAQIGVGILLEIATNSGGRRLAAYEERDGLGPCGHGACGKPASFLVGPDRGVGVKNGDAMLLAVCADDLAHAVATVGVAYETPHVEVLHLPTAPADGTMKGE